MPLDISTEMPPVASADVSPTAPAETAIEATGLRVSLGGEEILHGVDLRVNLGATVALLGGNGSGKTTLLRALLGLLPHDSGEIRLFGTLLDAFRNYERLGYIPQRSALQVPKATVAEIVNSGRLARRRMLHPPTKDDNRAVARAISQVRMDDLVHAEMGELSGGQRQRVIIARALAGEPDLLLLDEPLAGLDTQSQEALAQILTDLKALGLTILVVLHEFGPVEPLIDTSVVLREGRVIYSGPLASGSQFGHAHPEDDGGLRRLRIPLLSPDQPLDEATTDGSYA
jgi:zinc transport system ATP-binding protein